MTVYKQLCAELVEIWDNTNDFDYNDFGNAVKDLVTRARAALAEPKPERLTGYKQLCAELVDAIDSGIPAGRMRMSPLMLRARAALDEPEPEYPSDKELLELMPETMRDEFSYAAKVNSDVTGVKPGIFRVALNTAALEYAQAILARWGK